MRRIKHLGFSDLVHPGATHTRFAHSIGVFHTARKLMNIVCKQADIESSHEQITLIAALLHDVGYGLFSHAFEAIGKMLVMEWVDHESISDKLICEGELGDILNKFNNDLAKNVADMIKNKGNNTLYNAVVSS